MKSNKCFFYFCILLLFLSISLCFAKPTKSALNTKLSSISAQKKRIKQMIEQKKRQKSSVLGELDVVERRLETAQTKLAANKLKLLGAQSDLRATTVRLQRSKRMLKRRQNLLSKRVVDMYKGEDLNYFNVILGSSNMWSFLSNTYYLQQMIRSDTQLIDQIKKSKAQIEKDQKRLTTKVTQIAGLQVALVKGRNQESALAQNKYDQITAIESSKDLYERAYNELEAQSRRIENQIRQYQNTSAGRARLARAFKGGLSMPLSGRITSTFGYRRHPITHVYKLHTGIDIAARTGTPIHAAADGTVILSGWMGAYGNAIIIDHGGGVSTLYGHCSRLIARVGQDVKRGQVIAKVGSTGYSTGPHCHFERRENGKPINPR